ncbi:MAG: hypothetical protein IKJ80_04890 [Clostridia bacterium]|nr:hypothetical protein [Clostridia bacterium]
MRSVLSTTTGAAVVSSGVVSAGVVSAGVVSAGVVSAGVVAAGVVSAPSPPLQAQSIKSIAKTRARSLMVFLVMAVLLIYFL